MVVQTVQPMELSALECIQIVNLCVMLYVLVWCRSSWGEQRECADIAYRQVVAWTDALTGTVSCFITHGP